MYVVFFAVLFWVCSSSDPSFVRPARPGRAQKEPAPALTPKILIKEHMSKLTNFELSEVLEYPRIYYFGAAASKIKGIPWAPNNHGLRCFVLCAR